MQIRNATDADIIDCHFLFIREYKETRAREAGLMFRHGDILVKFHLIIKQPQFGILMVAEEDDRIVGYIYGPYHKGWDADDDLIVWHEIGWYVRKEYRGRGIGLALFRAAEQSVIASGKATHMSVTTAIGFGHEKMMQKYEEAGFTPLQITYVKRVRED